jgi:hypothetical protein
MLCVTFNCFWNNIIVTSRHDELKKVLVCMKQNQVPEKGVVLHFILHAPQFVLQDIRTWDLQEARETKASWSVGFPAACVENGEAQDGETEENQFSLRWQKLEVSQRVLFQGRIPSRHPFLHQRRRKQLWLRGDMVMWPGAAGVKPECQLFPINDRQQPSHSAPLMVSSNVQSSVTNPVDMKIFTGYWPLQLQYGTT